jgi:hypothetical protein
MTSQVALKLALIEEPTEAGGPGSVGTRGGIDRVLLTTFWKPGARRTSPPASASAPAPVICITTRKPIGSAR